MFETTNQYILAQTRTTTYGIDGAPLQPRHVKWGSTQVVESDGLIRQLLVLVNFKAVFGDFRVIFDVT